MNTFKDDLTSGFLVFLIALPLCLGIAMASGFPPVAGVLSAIVGGLFASHLGSASLTIKGPAAGLIVIALGAVQELGGGDPILGYKRALAVGVVAAIVQILFALAKAGRFASIMPPSVVHGMLAAIGVIIIAKQTPIVLGVVGAHGEPLEMLAEIPHFISEANPWVALIGVIGILILKLAPTIPGIKLIPAPVLVLGVAVPLSAWFGFSEHTNYVFSGEAFEVGPDYLVALPGNLLSAITFPDFSVITTFTSMKYVMMFALVGTIESLLSVIAVDGMDPEKHTSDLNKDLLITGVANLLSAMIGGLPMISEIVRSKANIDAHAKSQWSNFFHGGFLLLFVALVPGLLHMIPLAALAAMLVVTGARLASPSEFKHVFQIGKDQFGLFVLTFVLTLATDLLIGVAAGLLAKFVLHIIRSRDLAGLFASPARIVRDGEQLKVFFSGPVAFTNLLKVQESLKREVVPGVKTVSFDFTDAGIVDHTVQERLESMANEWPDVTLKMIGLDQLSSMSTHPHAFRQRKGLAS